MKKKIYVDNSFYWDDMTTYAFRGVYNPRENKNGFVLPYLTFAETLRFAEFIKNTNSELQFKFFNNFRLIIGNQIIPSITISNKVYYPIHFNFEWLPVILH